MSKASTIGIAAMAIGLIAAALPFVLPCSYLSGGSCGDGQALLIFPFLGLPIAAVGLMSLVGGAIARLIKPANSEIQDEEVNS